MAGFYENLTLQQYKKAMSGAYTYNGLQPQNISSVANGSNIGGVQAEINNGITTAENALVRAEDNHDDQSTFLQKVGNSFRDVKNNITHGVFNFFDAIGDFFMGAVGTVASWFGNTDLQQSMSDAINYDWTSQATKAMDWVAPAFFWDYWNGDRYADGIGSPEQAQQYLSNIDRNTILGAYAPSVNNITNAVETGVGQMLPSLATGNIIGGIVGSGANATNAVRTANIITQSSLGFVQGAGRGYATVASEGKPIDSSALGYATVRGIIQGAEQGLSAGLGGTFANDRVRNFLGEKVTGALMRGGHSTGFSNFIGNTLSLFTDVAMDASLDAIEEAIDPALKQIYDSEAWNNAYGSEEARKETAEKIFTTFLTSALTSTLVDTTRVITGSDRVDYAEKVGSKFVENTIANDGELAIKAERLNDLKTVVQEETEVIKALETKLESETDEKVKAEIKADLETTKTELDKTLVESTKLSQEITSDLQEKFYNPNKLEKIRAEESARAEIENENIFNSIKKKMADSLMSTSEKEASESFLKRGKSYRDIDGFHVKMRSDTTDLNNVKLQFKPKSTSETVNVLDIAKGTDSTVLISGLTFNLPIKSDLAVNTSKLDDGSIISIRDSIATTTNYVSKQYVNKDSGDTFVEYSDGTTLLITNTNKQQRNSEITEVNGNKPEWATDENVQNLSQTAYANDHTSLIKQASPEKYIDLKDVREVFNNNVLDVVKRTSYSTIDFKDSGMKLLDDNWERNFQAKYSLAKGDKERDVIIQGAVTDFLNCEFKYYYRVYDDESSSYKNIDRVGKVGDYYTDDEIEELRVAFKDFIESNTRPSDFANEKANMEKAFAKTDADRIRAINNLQQKLNILKQRYNTSNLIHKAVLDAVKYTNRAKKPQGATMSNPYLQLEPITTQYLTPFRNFTKYGKVNADFGAKAIFGKLEYNEDTVGEVLFDKDVQDKINELKSHYSIVQATDENGKVIDTQIVYYGEKNHEGVKTKNYLTSTDEWLFADVLNKLRKQNSSGYYHKKLDSLKSDIAVVQEVKALVKDQSFNALGASVQGYGARFRNLFGANSQAYDVMYGDVIRGHQQASITKYQLVSEMNTMLKSRNLTPFGLLSYIDVLGYRMTKGEAMQLYMHSLSPENYTQMVNHGATYKYKNKRVDIKFNDDFKADLESKLTADEKGFVTDLFNNGYNGSSQKILQEYSMSHYGFNAFDKVGYVHRKVGDLNITPDNAQQIRASSLGTNLTVERVNHSGKLDISNVIDAYSDYAQEVGTLVNNDAMQRLNAIVNKKDDKGITINGYFQKTNKGRGSELLNNWLNSANGIQVVKDGGGFISKLFTNAMLTPIELNVGTFLKMNLDALRLPATAYNGTRRIQNADGTFSEVQVTDQRIGWGSLLRGIWTGFVSRFGVGSTDLLDANGNVVYDDKGNAMRTSPTKQFREQSSFYIRANENGAVLNRYLVNNAYNRNMSRIRNVLSKGLEVSQNDMMAHIAFPTMQQFAKKMGYGEIGTDDNTKKAIEIFDTVSLTALSNGDTLDTSDLRSGRSGILVRSLFGVFGGDSQKRIEQWTEALTGGTKSRKRQQRLQQLSTETENTLNTLKIERAGLEEEYQAQKILLEQAQEEGRKTAKLEIQLNAIDKQIQLNEAKQQGYENTLTDISKQIRYEQEYSSRPAIAKRAGLIASTFVVAVLAEQAINIFNDLFKGKDTPTTESFMQDLGFDMSVGWLPYISTIANAIRYNDNLNSLQTQGLRQLIDVLKQVKEVASGESKNYVALMYSLTETIGSLTGIPIKSLSDYVVGGMKNIDRLRGNVSYGEYITTLFNGYSSAYLSRKTKEYLEKGDLSLATRETQANMVLYKTTGNVEWNVAKEITRLKASVSARPSEYNQAQTDTFNRVYSKANSIVKSYVSSQAYQSLSDENKKKALEAIYKAYYEVAKNVVNSDDTIESKLGKALYKHLVANKNLTLEERKLLRTYKIVR